ncbi:hypothetical protein Tco_0150158 [Tanacetum coccineum]
MLRLMMDTVFMRIGIKIFWVDKNSDAFGWEDPKVQPMKPSFVNVVTSDKQKPKVNFRTLDKDESVEDSDFVLPLEAVVAAQNKFANSLVGYFVEKTIAFPLVKNYVTNTWAKYGFQKVIKDDDGFFSSFKFTFTNKAFFETSFRARAMDD